jgi:hypothetical protein
LFSKFRDIDGTGQDVERSAQDAVLPFGAGSGETHKLPHQDNRDLNPEHPEYKPGRITTGTSSLAILP